MKYNWENLPKPLNCFTVRNAVMVNLNTGKAVRHYATNTKIVVVQKCITPDGTYYRTSEAEQHYLNYAFMAADFGLPNETAPLAHPSKFNSSNTHSIDKSAPRTKLTSKTKNKSKTTSSKSGERRLSKNWFKNIFRRSDG